jgi:nucleotide-binding universal stress UspA family protein
MKQTTRNMVVGIDFSDQSRIALEQAIQIAGVFNYKMRIVHVVESCRVKELAAEKGQSTDDLRTECTQAARLTLRQWFDELSLSKHHSFRVRYGNAAREIVIQIKEVNADLLITGMSGVTGLQTGSGMQAGKLARAASCGMLMVAPEQKGPYKRIVVGIDFSEASKKAAETALWMAHIANVELLFVHVYPETSHQLHFPDVSLSDHLNKLTSRLRVFVGETAGMSTAFLLHHCTKDSMGLIEISKQHKADLLIIGRHGFFSFKHLLFGSTTVFHFDNRFEKLRG